VVKTATGNVFVDEVIVGVYSIDYEDVKEDRAEEAKETRSVTVTAYLNDVVVGSVTLTYEDIITAKEAGVRDIHLTGTVEVA